MTVLSYIPGQLRVRIWAITGEHATMYYVPSEAIRIVDGYDYLLDAHRWLTQHGIVCERVELMEDRAVTLTPDQIAQIEAFLSCIEDLGELARQLRDSLTNSQRAPATAKDAQAAYVIARGYQTIDGQICDTPGCCNLAVHIEPDGQMCCADCYRDQVLAGGAGAGEVAECHQ